MGECKVCFKTFSLAGLGIAIPIANNITNVVSTIMKSTPAEKEKNLPEKKQAGSSKQASIKTFYETEVVKQAEVIWAVGFVFFFFFFL